MLRPTSLLDVLAAVGAARAAGDRFSFRVGDMGADLLPELTSVTAEVARQHLSSRIDDGEVACLRGSDVDMLRGSGQQPTLARRAADLARIVTTKQIVAYREEGPLALRVSLRLEDRHESDSPAAHRAIGSEPVPRYSHPGRNLLAAAALVYAAADRPRAFTRGPVERSQADFYFDREWPVPTAPCTPSAWLAALEAGREEMRSRGWPIAWFQSRPAPHGQTVKIGTSRPVA